MNEAERIIARFGGIRPMAAKLGIAVTTVQGWKERGTIPQPRHAQILAAAEAEGISLDPAELAAAAGEPSHRGARRSMSPGFQTVDATAEETSDTSEDVKPAREPEAEKDEAEKDEEHEDVEDVEAEEVVRETDQPSPPPVSVRTRGAGSSLRTTSIGVLVGLILAAIIGGVGWYLGGAGGNADTKALAGRIAAAEQAAETARKQAAEAQAAAKAAAEKLAALEGPASAQAERLKAAEAQAGEAAKAAAALKADLAALETRLSAAASGETLQAIGREIAELRARIETLSKTTGAGSGDGASSAAVAENAGKIAANAVRLTAAQTRSEALEKSLKAEIARLEEAAQGLTARLTALERQVASTVAGGAGRGREASLVAAIGQLREAVRAGRAYKDELEAVRSLAEDPPTDAMTTLQASAAKGVTEARLLRARFPATAVAVLRAARLSKKSGWIDRAIARARSVVVIRRTGPGVKGSGPEAIVARAEVQLDAGDLAGAVDTLSALEGEAAEAAKPWLDAARAHIAALAAVGSLHRAALARIGAAKPPAGTGGSTGKNAGTNNGGTTAQ